MDNKIKPKEKKMNKNAETIERVKRERERAVI
jgi:hypothetical protein